MYSVNYSTVIYFIIYLFNMNIVHEYTQKEKTSYYTMSQS